MTTDSDEVRVTLLGTGTSTGVPLIGCDCRVCRSTDPRDNRLRCSCLIEAAGVSILIDAGPDFRTQALRTPVRSVDAVLFTHHHFDHVVGLDDLRPYLFQVRSPIPCYALPETEAELRSMFGYIFEDGSYPGVANLELRPLNGPIEVTSRRDTGARVRVVPLRVKHGETDVAGFRVGRFAYLTDTNHIPEEVYPDLEGLDVLVLDALRRRPHRTHFSIDQAIVQARRIGAAETWFVHMTHSVLHEKEDRLLPPGIRLGYDGLTLSARLSD